MRFKYSPFCELLDVLIEARLGHIERGREPKSRCGNTSVSRGDNVPEATSQLQYTAALDTAGPDTAVRPDIDQI